MRPHLLKLLPSTPLLSFSFMFMNNLPACISVHCMHLPACMFVHCVHVFLWIACVYVCALHACVFVHCMHVCLYTCLYTVYCQNTRKILDTMLFILKYMTTDRVKVNDGRSILRKPKKIVMTLSMSNSCLKQRISQKMKRFFHIGKQADW